MNHTESVKNAVEKHANRQLGEFEYKRTNKVGFNLLKIQIGETKALEVLEVGTTLTKTYGELDSARVINLETGEEQTMWLDGFLKYHFSQFEKLPVKIELTKLEKAEATVIIDGKATEKEVNQYEMFFIE